MLKYVQCKTVNNHLVLLRIDKNGITSGYNLYFDFENLIALAQKVKFITYLQTIVANVL